MAKKKQNNVFVFLPNDLDTKRIGFVHGYVKTEDDRTSIYVTSNKVHLDYSEGIGYCSDNTPIFSNKYKNMDNIWLHINSQTGRVQIYNGNQNIPYTNMQIICFLYDYEVFKSSDIIRINDTNYGPYIKALVKSVQTNMNNYQSSNFVYVLFMSILNLITRICDLLMPVVKYSAMMQHFRTTLATFKWIIKCIVNERKISLAVGNAITARIIDIYIGYLVLQWFMQFEDDFERLLSNFAEFIIDRLRELLKFLMGSPVGLKLNEAFNNTLGTFFLYHIFLWKTFLQATSPFLGNLLHLLTIPGLLGLTFQAALAADLLAFATFHVYCIYVYAARLYGLQLKSLTSLWKLFIGRKYNPLRQRVDSYQYNNQQLFIGTLAFTILLFLLPTTTLYYTVFTAFRVCLIFLDGCLLRMRYFLQCLPLYVTAMWLLRSSKASSSVHLRLKKSLSQEEPLTFNMTLTTGSWRKTINDCLPETMAPVPSVKWAQLVRNVITGSLF